MFNTNTFIPLYYQLKVHIESQIRSGAWQPGDQVPSESVLGEKFHVSRTTVRQALGELVNQGLLTRVQGKGTFVAHPRIRQRLTRRILFDFLWQQVFFKLAAGQVCDWPLEGLCSTPVIEGDRLYYVSNRCEVVCGGTDGSFHWKLDMIKELGVFGLLLAWFRQ